MSTLTISSLKANLSAALDEVKNGSDILVLDRNNPIARITKFDEGPLAGKTHLLAFEKADTLKRASKISPTALPEIIANSPVELKGSSALSALLEERETGR